MGASCGRTIDVEALLYPYATKAAEILPLPSSPSPRGRTNMRMRKTVRWSLLLACTVVLSPVEATAGYEGLPRGDEFARIIVGGVAGAVVETLGTIGDVKAGLAASEGELASIGWLVMGYLSGLMNLTGAVLVLPDTAPPLLNLLN